MKDRRKFQLLIADIRDALADVARENRYGDLFHATWELVRFEDELAGDIGKVRELIAVGRAIRDATGPVRENMPGLQTSSRRIFFCSQRWSSIGQ